MYKIADADVRMRIESDCRTFRALLELTDGTVISGEDVGKITLSHATNNDDTIVIGEILAACAEIELHSRYKLRQGDSFMLYLYLLDDSTTTSTEPATHQMLAQWQHYELTARTHEQVAYTGRTKDPDGVPFHDCFIPMGAFTVTKAMRQGQWQRITAYDRLAFSDAVYNPTITFPADSAAVVTDVLLQIGVTEQITQGNALLVTADGKKLLTADGQALQIMGGYHCTIDAAPVGQTCRDVLRHIAAVEGKNGMLTRTGAYTTAFLNMRGISIRSERMENLQAAEDTAAIAGIVCEVSDETTLHCGNAESSYTIHTQSPYMTAERLAALWEQLQSIIWLPCRFKEKLADPRRDLFDILFASGYFMPMTSSSLHFDGGLAADIESCGQINDY